MIGNNRASFANHKREHLRKPSGMGIPQEEVQNQFINFGSKTTSHPFIFPFISYVLGELTDFGVVTLL